MGTRPSQLPFSDQDSLETLLTQAEAKYQTRFEPVKVGQQELQILQIADMESHLDRILDTADKGQGLELPFWARIWPTSILLSYYAQRLPADAGLNLLEIGAGIGICGLFAAGHGLRVTISDINEEALLFTRINILKNNLQGKARVARCDFTSDRLETRFDIILGSEILYREDTYRPLCKFLSRHLASSKYSEVILAKNYRLKARQFFKMAQKEFDIQERVIGYKEQSIGNEAEKDKHLSQIYRMRPRKNQPNGA
ncbi:MAG: methyltransferase [Desulfohalobiaceae bacterium]|nr:methyltransferase [Desulfohalobiaceae bacterium]